jgi:hypothetical protein
MLAGLLLGLMSSPASAFWTEFDKGCGPADACDCSAYNHDCNAHNIEKFCKVCTGDLDIDHRFKGAGAIAATADEQMCVDFIWGVAFLTFFTDDITSVHLFLIPSARETATAHTSSRSIWLNMTYVCSHLFAGERWHIKLDSPTCWLPTYRLTGSSNQGSVISIWGRLLRLYKDSVVIAAADGLTGLRELLHLFGLHARALFVSCHLLSRELTPKLIIISHF